MLSLIDCFPLSFFRAVCPTKVLFYRSTAPGFMFRRHHIHSEALLLLNTPRTVTDLEPPLTLNAPKCDERGESSSRK